MIEDRLETGQPASQSSCWISEFSEKMVYLPRQGEKRRVFLVREYYMPRVKGLVVAL